MSDERYDTAEQVIRASFKPLIEKPKDRLGFLGSSFTLRNTIIRAVSMIDLLANSEISSEYSMEDLKYIFEHLANAAEPLQVMVNHFLGKAKKEARKASLAV